MTTCGECGKDVSTQAETCPGCGAPIQKPWGERFGLVTGLFIVGATIWLFSAIFGDKPVPKSSAQIEREAQRDAADTARRNLLARAATDLMATLRDPDSIRFDGAFVDAGRDMVCIRYRARNGFGGYGEGRFVYLMGKTGDTAKVWNATCTSPYFDMTHTVQLLEKR